MTLSYSGLTAAVLALLSATTVQATALSIVLPNQECGSIILRTYSGYTWPVADDIKTKYGPACQNPNALISQYAALFTYCQPHEYDASLKYMAQLCMRKGEVEMIPYTDFTANLTKEAIAALPVVESAHDISKKSNVTAPFLISQAWFDIALKSEHLYDYEKRLDAYYTYVEFGFWAIVVLFGIVQNVVRKTIESRQGFVYADAEGSAIRPGTGSKPGVFGRGAALVRKYVLTPSLLPPYHQQRFLGCTIPTRAESFVVLSYWIVSIILSFVNYHGLTGNTIWPNPSAQIWRYMADRMGTMAYGNLPILWIFSGRNNIFLWLTGWSFGTFNIFHRHIARITTLHAIMHGIGYSCYYFASGQSDAYHKYFEKLWWNAGVISVVMLSFIVLFSFSIVRKRLYESFLIIHIVLACLLLVFLYHHTIDFKMTDYNYPFLMTCVAIWGFDRVLRLVRQVYTNMHVRSGKGFQTTKSTVTYSEAANILFIDVVPANSRLFPGPGQHYYIYQPLRFFGWENHPFTLAHWTQPASPSDDMHLQFWVRPYDGWTKQLVKQCKAKGGSTYTIAPTLLIEGPYLANEPLHTFDEVLLIAGGSGISGVMPYLQDYVRRIEKGAAAGANGKIPTRTRNVTLIWADRLEDNMRAFAEGPLEGLLDRPDINVFFYVTGSAQLSTDATDAAAAAAAAATTNSSNVSSTAASSTDNIESSVTAAADSECGEKTIREFDTEKSKALADVAPFNERAANGGGLCIQAGRPDIPATVRKLAQSVQGTDARLAVMVCGPDRLADNVRHVVAQNMETSRESIQYFEETFGW